MTIYVKLLMTCIASLCIFMNWGSSDIDYSSYHLAIIQLSQRTKLNVALIVDTSCAKDDIIKLTTELRIETKAALCYEIDFENYAFNEIIQFLISSRGKITLTVLFQPWYISLDILEKMKYYGLINMAFVTIEIKPIFIRHLQHEDNFLKIINLQSTAPTKMMIGTKHSSFPSCSFMLHNSPKGEHAIISGCYDNPVKVIRVVTLFDMFVQSLPGHIMRNGACDIGLPCKVPTKSRYGNKTIWHWKCCSGAFIDVLARIIRTLKVSVDLYIVQDGTFNGLIYDVSAGKADIALQQLAPSANRFELVDFTPAVISTSEYMTILIRKGNMGNRVLDWSSLQHMTSISLIGLVVATFVIILVIFILENIGHVHEFNRWYSFRDSFSYINGLLFQRDIGGTLPRRWPGQVVALIFAFGMLVLVSAFTAQLTATNIIEVEHNFKGFKDKVFQDPNYKFGLLGDSHMDHWVRRLNLKAKKFKIQNVAESLDRLMNKSIDAYGSFSILIEHEISMRTHYKDKLRLHNEEGTANVIAFAFAKQSLIGIKLSNLILQMRESGELQQIYKVWGVACTTDIVAPIIYSKLDERIHRYVRYPIEYGLPLALVLGSASVCCTFLLLLEHCFVHLRDNRKKRYMVSGNERRRTRKINRDSK